MYFCGSDTRASLSFRVCTGLFLGLVCAAFATALPLSDNDMPNPTSSVHLAARNDLKRLPMMLRFMNPGGICELLDKHKTVKQVQAYLERMQAGFGFVPTISVEDVVSIEGVPDDPCITTEDRLYLHLKLKGSTTEESKEFWDKWGSWKYGRVQIASPFSLKEAYILQGRSRSITLNDNALKITGQPRIQLPPASISKDLL
ncbi:hypothetical protein GGU11DRAFT_782959 [Lentinula aff. detonsa]|nr:hypothetical protein GGU11DRAFT_782959 [Lentinula aff. detonsa]